MFEEVKTKTVQKKDEPFISVIIPTYNRAKELERAVNSVLNQNYTNFDLWIIDDGSTDETSKVIEKFQSKTLKEDSDFKPAIHYIKTENQGVSAARN
jgi:Glycosyltransferases involved in cell wall biogenesis